MTQQMQTAERASNSQSGVDLHEVNAWATGLEVIHARISRHFVRSEPRQQVLAYLQGLLGNVEQMNGWQLEEYVDGFRVNYESN